MTKRMKVGLAVVVTAGLLTGATAWAFGAHGGRPAMMKRVVSAVIDDALDAAHVSAEQRAAIHGARDRALAAIEEVRGERGARMEEILAVFEADAIDPARLEALRGQREREHARVAEAIEQALVDAHAVLTPDQRRALADYVRAHVGRRHAWHHMHQAGPGMGRE